MTASGPRSPCALVWFREDLRLTDNPALDAAARSGKPVVALYVLEDESGDLRGLGGASRWWLARSLRALAADCRALGLPFGVRRGLSETTVVDAAHDVGADLVVWNRRYDAGGIAIDTRIKDALRAQGLDAQSFNARLLHEPWEVATKSGDPMKVYSPFWRAACARGEPRAPLPKLTAGAFAPGPTLKGEDVASLGLEPAKPDWAGGLRNAWTPGEAGARAQIETFLESGLKGYAEGRNRPDRNSTSRMSPRLRFGEVSPHQLWHSAGVALGDGRASATDVDKFRSELGWREFSYHLLFHFPDLATVNFQRRFDAFPWRKPDPAQRLAWRKGRTGYPIVDAGMRQLGTTGWMHNRVRMIVGSFLIKDLMIDWRDGEDWFWDTLVDADPANNAASWQWVAGSGADAAPYFRVFNPSLQGEKFDPDGAYVRAHVPELARLAPKWIHRPWEAPSDVLAAAEIQLGRDYPHPMVDHGAARDRALAAFDQLKAKSA